MRGTELRETELLETELDAIEAHSGDGLRRRPRDGAASGARRWRELAEHAPGVLLLLGHGGVILELSAPLCGRAESFWRGRRLAEAFGADEGRPIARALGALGRGTGPEEVEVPVASVSGEPRLYRVLLAHVASDAEPRDRAEPRGRVLFSAFVSDVTDQVAAEQVLRDREALLSRRHKSAMLAYLAGGVAHDLNNLLTVIVGSADLLGEDASLDDDTGLRSELAQIQSAGARATEITRQLLAFSRREPSRPLVLDLGTYIVELSGLLARLLGPGIRLELSFAAEPWLVRLDPLYAEHVVTHLVLHARQAMPHGGVLWLSLRSVHVDSFQRKCGVMVGPGDYVELSVRDTGTGMSQAAMERAFEPFFAAEHLPATTDLSLPLVRHLVVHSFGHVWVESEAGRGTVFHVLFPRYDEQRASAPPRHHPPAAAVASVAAPVASSPKRPQASLPKAMKRTPLGKARRPTPPRKRR
jgi:signal transduction histidine kinase